MRAEYPNQLDYSGFDEGLNLTVVNRCCATNPQSSRSPLRSSLNLARNLRLVSRRRLDVFYVRHNPFMAVRSMFRIVGEPERKHRCLDSDTAVDT